MNKDILYIDSLIRAYSKQQIFAVTLLLTLAISIIQYVAAYELAFASTFLLPIATATWYVGRRQGLFLCVFASAICFLHGTLITGHNSPSIPYFNALNQIILFSLICYSIDQFKQGWEQQQKQQRTDQLTGVMNNQGFNEASQQLIALAKRNGSSSILAYVDLDNLQQMNQQFGTSVGDKALQEVGQHFRNSMRKTDVIARIGEDSFAILLPETSATGARSKLGKLRNELSVKAHDHKWPIGFSIGAIAFDKPPANIDEAMSAADQLMHQLRSNGKNCFVFEHYPQTHLH